MKEIITSFMRSSLPCNPIPFANALIEGIRANGADWIKTDEANAVLHLLNQMAMDNFIILMELVNIKGCLNYLKKKRVKNTAQ